MPVLPRTTPSGLQALPNGRIHRGDASSPDSTLKLLKDGGATKSF